MSEFRLLLVIRLKMKQCRVLTRGSETHHEAVGLSKHFILVPLLHVVAHLLEIHQP